MKAWIQSILPLHLLLVLATTLCCWDVWSFEFVNFDDQLYVYENPHVLSGLTSAGFYHHLQNSTAATWSPLTMWSLMLDAELFGPEPSGFHVTSLLFHLLNSVLLFEIFRYMTRRPWLSFLTALVFAIHPLRAESVAWISSRKDVVFTCFGLLSIAAYAVYTRRHSKWWYLASFAAFGMSLLAKAMLVTLPCLLLVLDVWPLRRTGGWFGRLMLGTVVRERNDSREGHCGEQTAANRGSAAAAGETVGLRRLLLEKVPYLVLAMIVAAVSVHTQRAEGAMVELSDIPLPFRIGNAVLAYGYYIKSMFWPTSLSPYYPHPRGSLDWMLVAISGTGLVLTSVVAVALRRRLPEFLAGWLWFLGTLVPVIGIVQVGTQQRADRYTYFTTIGLTFMLIWLAAAVCEKSPRLRRVSTPVSICLCLLLIAVSFRQHQYWANSLRLWSHTVAVTRNNHHAETQLAMSLQAAGNRDAASDHYRIALAMNPDDQHALVNYGVFLAQSGELADASAAFERVLRAAPQHVDANLNLGLVRYQQEHPGEAEQFLKRASETDPSRVLPWYWLGRLKLQQGDRVSARQYLKSALRADPNFGPALRQLERLETKRAPQFGPGPAGPDRVVANPVAES